MSAAMVWNVDANFVLTMALTYLSHRSSRPRARQKSLIIDGAFLGRNGTRPRHCIRYAFCIPVLFSCSVTLGCLRERRVQARGLLVQGEAKLTELGKLYKSL